MTPKRFVESCHWISLLNWQVIVMVIPVNIMPKGVPSITLHAVSFVTRIDNQKRSIQLHSTSKMPFSTFKELNDHLYFCNWTSLLVLTEDVRIHNQNVTDMHIHTQVFNTYLVRPLDVPRFRQSTKSTVCHVNKSKRMNTHVYNHMCRYELVDL